MSNPRVSAIVSVVGIVIVGSMMLFSQEEPSTGVVILQWVLLAAGVVGLIGSLMQMGSKR
jgi:hypothetical protein